MAGAKGTKGGGKAAPVVTPEQVASIAGDIMEQAATPQQSLGAVVVRDSIQAARPGTYVVGRVITGWSYGDRGAIEHGEVFQLMGLRGDEKLVRLGYVTVFDGRVMPKPISCRLCAKTFTSVGTMSADRCRTIHGEKAHIEPARRPTPMEEDAHADKLDRKVETETPLYLDKTTASLGA